MSDGGWALWAVTIALPLLIAGAVVGLLVRARRTRCATCRGRLEPLADPALLRCRRCGAEARRDARKAHRTGIPHARVHR